VIPELVPVCEEKEPPNRASARKEIHRRNRKYISPVQLPADLAEKTRRGARDFSFQNARCLHILKSGPENCSDQAKYRKCIDAREEKKKKRKTGTKHDSPR